MKFCRYCGKEHLDEAVICPHCGCATKEENRAPSAETNDSISIGLVVLSIFIPLFGIIYWPVMAKSRPRCAKTCGIAAIISWAVYFVFWTLILG